MNLFQKAIQENRLAEFALGLNEFFIPDREYGDHWVLAAWQQHILPMLQEDKNLEAKILDMLSSMLNSNLTTEEIKTNLLLYHLHVFYYDMKNGNLNLSDFLSSQTEKFMFQIEKTKQLNSEENNLEKNQKIDFAIDLIRRNGGLR
jgi:hypothetical protein